MKLGFFPYYPLHYKAAQAYLDRKAEQGLELQKVYLGCIARFERAEAPHHFVDLDLEQKSYNDPDRPWRDYFQLCADGGWQYIQTIRGMLLFRAMPGRDPTPVQTDEAMEFDRFWQRYRPKLWKSHFPTALLVLAWFGLSRFTNSYFSSSSLLATNAGLYTLFYFGYTLLILLASFVSSRLYLSRCRKTDRIEPPGKASTVVDSFSLLYRLLGIFAALLLLSSFYLPFNGLFPREYLSYHSDPQLGNSDPAILDELEAYPILTIQRSDLPGSSIYSESVSGGGSLLVRCLRQMENFTVDEKGYTLVTERYQCANPAVARLLLPLRLRDARNSGSITWSSDWTPTSLPGFDECYISYNNGHSEYGYLLFRQGNVVAMVACLKGGSLDPVDLTTPGGLAFIQEHVLPTSQK